MPANRLNRSFLALVTLVTVLMAAGCAGQGYQPPVAPDESVLAPAQQALDTALTAQADDFAPRPLDAARRRIATARDILFSAARAKRKPDDTETARVHQLVYAARLDAKSALTQTQALAVQAKIAELQGRQGGGSAAAAPDNRRRASDRDVTATGELAQ